MKKLFLLGLLLLGATPAWAFQCPNVTGSTTNFACTQIVFNDSGGALTSGSVVVWDNDDTEFDRTGYPYVTTTTTADVDWVAGVTVDDSCADQALCEAVVWGPAITRVAALTDLPVEDTTVSTTTVAGQAGDWDGGANECSLGLLMENVDAYNQAPLTSDNQSAWVFVNPSCED